MFNKKKAKKLAEKNDDAVSKQDSAVENGNVKSSSKRHPVASLDDFLLGSVENSAGDVIEIPEEDKLLKLKSEYFYADDQVRKTFDDHEIEEMAASLRENGQIQPIVVHPADEDGRHKIDKGECRWRAATLLNNFVLKAVIDPEAPSRTKTKRIISQFIENDQRNDVPPFDQAIAIKELIEEGMTMEEIAEQLGWITRSHKKPNTNKVSRILSILKLPEEGQKLVRNGVVTDLITLEFIRKIHDSNPEKFSVVCDLAIEEKGLTRKRAEQEYKQCKLNESGENESSNQTQQKQPGRQSSNSQGGTSRASSHKYPTIHIECNDGQSGMLLLEKKHSNAELAYIQLPNDDVVEVELNIIKIKRIEL